MNINFSNHLAIGFQQYWLDSQNINRQSLLEILYLNCVRQNVDVVGITSEETRPIQGNHDRYGVLKNQLEDLRDKGYIIKDTFESRPAESMFAISHPEHKKIIFVLNSQTVQALPPVGQNVPYRVTLFGNRDYIESGKDLESTLTQAQHQNGIIILENPTQSKQHSERLMINLPLIDAFVGYDSQQGELLKNKNLSTELGKPYVAIGNQHAPSERSAYIKLNSALTGNIREKDELIRKIKSALRSREFENNEVMESFANRLSWQPKFFLETQVYSRIRKLLGKSNPW